MLAVFPKRSSPQVRMPAEEPSRRWPPARRAAGLAPASARSDPVRSRRGVFLSGARSLRSLLSSPSSSRALDLCDAGTTISPSGLSAPALALDPRSSPLLVWAHLETTVFLIHPGATNWHRDGLLLGRRDIPMNDQGRAQAERVAEWLAGAGVAEVISSPLQRSLQTATIIGRRFGIDVARDHRLIDFHIGQWEGKPPAEVMASDEYEEFFTNPLSTRIPGGETIQEVKNRAVAAIEQTLEDNPAGATIAVVTHARVIRVLLTHYMSAPPSTYHFLRIHPGSISVLAFSYESQRPRVLAVNWSGELRDILAQPEQPV